MLSCKYLMSKETEKKETESNHHGRSLMLLVGGSKKKVSEDLMRSNDILIFRDVIMFFMRDEYFSLARFTPERLISSTSFQ